ncbi:MAG: hypothetical protein JRG80_14700 [Deltaproteobacteria bacterium]|nr:hypothetical protein [Deltaproteobacteria bacterium]MBW2400508.1 hypothetical protein [Deltaproteobacteria bacterium]MBW2667389.1 hypothetical protein [Deltaproteobacteria bacterium]
MTTGEAWRRCSTCKQPIELGATYWVCNVSTCNRKRTGLVFCTVTCWEVHLPEANHRETWAVEKSAPQLAEADSPPEPKASRDVKASREVQGTKTGQRRIVPASAASFTDEVPPREILIVASRLKEYIRAKSGFNTSDGVLAPLSDAVRRICDEAIANAARLERKTVLERDISDDSR